MTRLEGKVALVTGGANGIGEAICRQLHKEGAKVVIADISFEDASYLAADLSPDGSTALALEVDMSSESQVASLIAATVKWGGRLNILVNNAARFVFAEIAEVTEEDLDCALGTNVKGYVFATKHAVRAMREQGHGSSSQASGCAVVNIASISSFIAQPGFVPYSATKGAILQLTRCSALDCGKYGIRVNAVCPGPILTDGTKKHAASLGQSLDEVVKGMTNHMIIHRMGKPEEVATAVAFLASSEASFITGSTLMVDGGYCTV